MDASNAGRATVHVGQPRGRLLGRGRAGPTTTHQRAHHGDGERHAEHHHRPHRRARTVVGHTSRWAPPGLPRARAAPPAAACAPAARGGSRGPEGEEHVEPAAPRTRCATVGRSAEQRPRWRDTTAASPTATRTSTTATISEASSSTPSPALGASSGVPSATTATSATSARVATSRPAPQRCRGRQREGTGGHVIRRPSLSPTLQHRVPRPVLPGRRCTPAGFGCAGGHADGGVSSRRRPGRRRRAPPPHGGRRRPGSASARAPR